MNSANRPLRLLTVAALGAAALAFILRLISVLFFYDTEIGYYTAGAILPIISNITLVLSAVALIVLPLCTLSKGRTVATPSGLSRWCALIPALFMAIHAIKLIAGSMSSGSVMTLLSLLASIAATGFFCCLAFVDRPSGVTVGCGVGFVLFLGLSWLSSYTDFTVAMNSPDKLFFNIACVGAALFTVGELRANYDTARARTYHCYSALALLILCAGPAVAVIGNIFGRYSGNAARSEDLPLLALAVYIAVRIATLSYTEPLIDTDVSEFDEYDDYDELYEAVETTETNETSDTGDTN